MPKRKIPVYSYDKETQNKILDTATELFARKCFCAVSLREIAKAVGIKMPSLQYYYKHKDDIIKDVLSRFEIGYLHYIDWLSEENLKVNSLEALLDNYFNEEFIEMQDPIGCLGMSIVIKEQHHNASAREQLFKNICEYSINSIKGSLDRLIEKGIFPPSNTKMIATLLMLIVTSSNELRLHKYFGTEPPINCLEVYKYLKYLIGTILKNITI